MTTTTLTEQKFTLGKNMITHNDQISKSQYVLLGTVLKLISDRGTYGLGYGEDMRSSRLSVLRDIKSLAEIALSDFDGQQ